jgi:hypothetical protein
VIWWSSSLRLYYIDTTGSQIRQRTSRVVNRAGEPPRRCFGRLVAREVGPTPRVVEAQPRRRETIGGESAWRSARGGGRLPATLQGGTKCLDPGILRHADVQRFPRSIDSRRLTVEREAWYGVRQPHR